MASSYASWNPYKATLQESGISGLVDGRTVSGAQIGLFAGPPRLASIGGALTLGAAITNPEAASQIVYPIGITQNFNISHNRQFARIFELGSERSFFISGRTVGQVGLSRVLYHGPSLLRVLYAYYEDTLPDVVVPSVFPNVGASAMANPHDVQIPPGYENLYINLASDLFSQPIGILVVVKDNNIDTYGAFYLENCYLPNHSFATDAQGVIVQESVAVQFEMAVPIATRSIELIS